MKENEWGHTKCHENNVSKIPHEDIKLVMEQTKSSENEAKNALKETKGDIAAAILKLSKKIA